MYELLFSTIQSSSNMVEDIKGHSVKSLNIFEEFVCLKEFKSYMYNYREHHLQKYSFYL